MRKITTCLLTLVLLLPALARDRSAGERDCTTRRFVNDATELLISDCIGETVSVTLTSKSRITQCFDENGHETTTVHFELHGTGVGLTSGNRYVLNQVSKSSSVFTLFCGLNLTAFTHSVLVSQGTLPNLRVLLKTTITVDDQCIPHVEDEIKVDCQD